MPLSEEDSESDNELFSMDDIKLEVMRARGAGGQVGVQRLRVSAASYTEK